MYFLSHVFIFIELLALLDMRRTRGAPRAHQPAPPAVATPSTPAAASTNASQPTSSRTRRALSAHHPPTSATTAPSATSVASSGTRRTASSRTRKATRATLPPTSAAASSATASTSAAICPPASASAGAQSSVFPYTDDTAQATSGGSAAKRRRTAPPARAASAASETSCNTEAAPVPASLAQLRELVTEVVQAAINERPLQQPVHQELDGFPATSALSNPGEEQTPSTSQAALLDAAATPIADVSVGVTSGMPGITIPDIDFTISSSLRQDICAHKFIDLGLLLSHQETDGDQMFQLIDGRLRPGRSVRPINTFSAWCTAFLRFAGVYVAQHPADAAGLLLHMRQVSHLNQPGMGMAWREFDQQFRRARELAPQSYPWGATIPTSAIWLSAMGRGMGAATRGHYMPRSAGRAATFRGCYQFNSAKGCRRSNCAFAHVCRWCSGAHSGLNCFKRSGSARGNPVTRSVAPRPTAPAKRE